MSSPTATLRAAPTPALDQESELRRAVEDIERGDYIELTPGQLERCAIDEEWPWPDESLDEHDVPEATLASSRASK